jgi:hypothetical protein
MTIALKRVLALLVAPIALFGMVFSISTTAANADGTTQQSASGEQDMATQATEISTDVRPWCGWTALTAGNDSITLVPSEGQDTVYDGDAISLVAEGQEFAIKVGPAGDAVPVGEAFAQELPDNCSWFADDQKNAVDVRTTLDGIGFDAVSDANADSAPDMSMNFEADPSNPFSITNVAASCGSPFIFDAVTLDVTDVSVANTGVAVVSMAAINVGTNDFCAWTSDYSVEIPAGQTPLFGDSTYTYVGPTITNTMIYSR